MKRDSFAITLVKPRNPKKLSGKCWPLANNENTIAVEPRFTVQAIQPTDLNCLLGCWFLSFNIFFSYFSISILFFLGLNYWNLQYYKGNSSNVFIHIFLRNVASDYIVVEELLNQVGGLTVEAILLLMNVLPPTRIPCRLLNPWLFFSILAARSSVVPFEEWRQNWVIIFAYS